MQSLRELYRIGVGPSSSHTMGPRAAAEAFLATCPEVERFVVRLYGSLAATGKGHLTDVAVLSVLTPRAPCEIVWIPEAQLPYHPNGMVFEAYGKNGKIRVSRTFYSVGGGAILNAEDIGKKEALEVYSEKSMTEMLELCNAEGLSFWEYVQAREDPAIWDYLSKVWSTMKAAVERGLENEGRLPGELRLARKAASFYIKARNMGSPNSHVFVFSYALAVSEENASGGTVVTAPTCGSCGVLPAVLYHFQKVKGVSDAKILRALATAGLFGNVAKHNASISGAEAGCQAEVGVASSMAAAAACQLEGGTPSQIEYVAEMGLEHFLGMTCDPVCGLVQIPCIERNAFAATRALDASTYANFSDGQHRVSYDRVLEVMKETGRDLPSLYRETSEGGLAKGFRIPIVPAKC